MNIAFSLNSFLKGLLDLISAGSTFSRLLRTILYPYPYFLTLVLKLYSLAFLCSDTARVEGIAFFQNRPEEHLCY